MVLNISAPVSTAVTCLFHSIAFLSTFFRLYRRYIQKHLWWDDFCAFLAFLLDLVYYAIAIGMKDDLPGNSPRMTPERRQRKIAVFWITGTLPPLIVWLSRISICLLIARIDIQHTAIRIRLWSYLLIIAFALVGCAMFFQKVWICTQSTAWHYSPSVVCQVGKTAGFISLTGDILADTILTVISLRLLWKVHMRRSQRRLLSWLFGANIWSSLVGILYGAVVINANKLGPARPQIIGLVVNLKTSITLTVCNLVVVVTYLYARYWRSSEDSDSDSGSTPDTRRHSKLPDGRTTKQVTNGQPSTILILTEVNSDQSIMTWDQRIRRDITTTLMTCASSDLRWLPRTPPRSRSMGRSKRVSHHTSFSTPSLSDETRQLSSLSRSVSEPSSHGRNTRTLSHENSN